MDFFDPELVIARLKEQQFEFEIVEGAAEYAAIQSLGGFRPGSLYVVLIREQNAAGDSPQPRAKAVATVTFGVIAVAKNFRGQSGLDALRDAKPVVGRVRQALLGWVPPGCSTPCKWLQGDVMDYDKTNLLWADVFTTTHVLGA